MQSFTLAVSLYIGSAPPKKHLSLQNGTRNLKEDPFLTLKRPSELFGTAVMDQDRSFFGGTENGGRVGEVGAGDQ